VVFDTLIAISPTGLEKAGLPPEEVQQSLRDVYKEVAPESYGGNILPDLLTGPVYIDGAEPGDTLEVRIQKIDLAIPYAFNGPKARARRRKDSPYARTKIIPLDRERMVAKLARGIEAPLHPFFGTIQDGGSADDHLYPFDPFGDFTDAGLVAGSSLYLPVRVKGVLFEIGNGHAGQGLNEDSISLATSLIGALQFVVHKGLKIDYPHAETPTDYIFMGMDKDGGEAAEIAVRQMVDFLVSEKHLSREDAYMLTGVTGEVFFKESFGTYFVCLMMPKAIFVK
jgi:acetamidase/formamidase